MTKMTYVEALNIALTAVADNAEVTEKLTALREQIAKRNSTENRKPTKAQALNIELAEVVREVLTNSAQPMTITEIMKADERLSTLSNQKVTAVVRSMGDAVVKVPDKRVNRFALA